MTWRKIDSSAEAHRSECRRRSTVSAQCLRCRKMWTSSTHHQQFCVCIVVQKIAAIFQTRLLSAPHKVPIFTRHFMNNRLASIHNIPMQLTKKSFHTEYSHLYTDTHAYSELWERISTFWEHFCSVFMYKVSLLGLHLQLFEDSSIYWGSGWHRRSFCSQMQQVYINLRGFFFFKGISQLQHTDVSPPGARSDLKGILHLRFKYSQVDTETRLKTLAPGWDEPGKGDCWRFTSAQPAESLALWALTGFSTFKIYSWLSKWAVNRRARERKRERGPPEPWPDHSQQKITGTSAFSQGPFAHCGFIKKKIKNCTKCWCRNVTTVKMLTCCHVLV